jgi:hypothetical protein
LQANSRQTEADEFFHQAYDWLMKAATNIEDDNLRQSYLENMRENQALLWEVQERGIVTKDLGNVGVT